MMKSAALLASLLATASAFAPVSQKTSVSTSLNSFEAELGVQPPIGFWDPLGLLNGASQEKFDRLRYVEIKHGRICMLAVVGQLVTRAGIRMPGYIDYAGDKFSDYPPGVAAITPETEIPKESFASICCSLVSSSSLS